MKHLTNSEQIRVITEESISKRRTCFDTVSLIFIERFGNINHVLAEVVRYIIRAGVIEVLNFVLVQNFPVLIFGILILISWLKQGNNVRFGNFVDFMS